MSAIGQQLIDLVRAKAAEKPDFRYRPPAGEGASCVYVYRRKPSCILGHALWDAGLIDREFQGRRVVQQSILGTVDSPANEEGFDSIASILGLELDPIERAWLEQVQSEQDDETPWGLAVEAADDFVKDFGE